MKTWQTYFLLFLFAITAIACAPHRPAIVEDLSSKKAAPPVIVSKDATANTPTKTLIVQPGDTLYKLGFKYQIDYKKIASFNDIKPPFTIFPGQIIRLTPPTFTHQKKSAVITQPVKIQPTITAKNNPVATPKLNKAQEQIKKTTPEKKLTKKNQSAKNIVTSTKENAIAATTAQKINEAKLKHKLTWQWPTKGKVISTFLASNPARKGISISGKEGQTITASESGVVVYSGNGLLGYGELIIIKHNETYLSAYGHNKRRFVHEGEMVKKGQKIAELGSSGTNVNNLHFEIRKNGDPINPLNHLPKS